VVIRETWDNFTDIICTATVMFVIVVFGFGCNASKPNRVDSAVMNRGIAWGAAAWRLEAGGFFRNPLLVHCHGGYGLDGTWRMYPDGGRSIPVEEVARVLGSVFHDRDVVLIVCNHNGVELKGPHNVWYAKSDVWAAPHFGMPLMYSLKVAGTATAFQRASP